MPWPVFLRGGPGIEALAGGRLWILRLLLGLPAGVDVGLQGLVETVANGLELDLDDWLPRALEAAFLDPLVAGFAAALPSQVENGTRGFRLTTAARCPIVRAIRASPARVLTPPPKKSFSRPARTRARPSASLVSGCPSPRP